MKNLNYGKLLADYGNVLVLLLLCAVISAVTLEEQSPRSVAAAEKLAEKIAGQSEAGANVVVLVRSGDGGQKFAANLESTLKGAGLNVTQSVVGDPDAARAALEAQAAPLAACLLYTSDAADE